MPYDIEFREELPKTLVGKVLRRALREEEEKKLAAEAKPEDEVERDMLKSRIAQLEAALAAH